MPVIQDYQQEKMAITPDYQHSPARRLDGSLSGLQQQSFTQHPVAIPMTSDNWRMLSRDTQMRVLEELGIMKAADAK